MQPSCHLSIQEPVTELVYKEPSDHIILRFKNCYISQKVLKSQQQPLCSTQYVEWTNNTPFTGWIGQGHLNTVSDSCPQKLDGEIFPLCSGIQSKQLNVKKFNFNVSMALLGKDVGEFYLMTHLGYVDSLKSTRILISSYTKIETT